MTASFSIALTSFIAKRVPRVVSWTPTVHDVKSSSISIKALEFITSYYADTLVDMGTTYNKSLIDPQMTVVQQQMAARGKTNLNGYLNTYWGNLQGYWKDGKVARDAWLNACKK